jgi:hypothetical protein
MLSRRLARMVPTNFIKTPIRTFGAMGEIDRSLFEYKFTDKMNF